jgi:dCMP deaminase
MERISYHQMFMNIAKEVSRRSTCCRKQVGSILVSDKQKIISCGWNGVPSGKEHCADVFSSKDRYEEDFYKIHGEWSKDNELHSELNCIIHCDRDKLKTSTLYTTLSPCTECAKIIIASEIKKVVYLENYDRDQKGIEILKNNNVEIFQINS